MNPLQPGECIHLITIKKPDPNSPKSAGQRQTVFLLVARVMASIQALSGRDAFIAAQRDEATTHLIRFFWGPLIANLDANHRIEFGRRIFVMERPPDNVNERNIEFACYCSEGSRTQN